MRIDIITLFPSMFEAVLGTSILKKAQDQGSLWVNLINLRDFGIGKHKVVDDKPYGGGVGMILRVDVLHKALQAVRSSEFGVRRKVGGNSNYELRITNPYTILLDPAGQKYNQKKAKELSQKKWLILICGHYEGVDNRIRNSVDEEISIGDFILSGGEIPAMVIIDSLTRLISGVLSKEEAVSIESFSQFNSKSQMTQTLLEFPQFTRPPKFQGLKVPAILLSGDHQRIEKWRKEKSWEKTKKLRPDLLKR